MRKRIYFFIGTTAELIKLAPVIKEAQKRKINFKIISSGQGELLSEEFSGYLKNFKADIAFSGKDKKSSVLLFTFWAIKTLFLAPILLSGELKNVDKAQSYFIVHGDTISSLIGAIVAKIYDLKLVHIESGLRSFDFFEPFPEELSRYIVSKLADIHFCPNAWCLNNLGNTGGNKINTFQNTLIESFWWSTKQKVKIKDFQKPKTKYFILVMHRQEHVIFGKEKSAEMIRFVLSNVKKDLSCVLVAYATSLDFLKTLNLSKSSMKKLFIIPRLQYRDFMELLLGAEYICTDGGSNQEESYYMGKPCLLLRKHTERREGLGQNVILSKLRRTTIKNFLINYKSYNRGKVHIRLRPSKMIVDYLIRGSNL